MAIKVLVIDDSAFMRRVIVSILEKDPEIQVIGYARNGVEGLAKIEKLKPDVVTLDIEMPEMDGLETLKRIMSTNPLPVVMLSAHTTEGAFLTIRALELGALDFVGKPEGKNGIEMLSEELPRKIKVATIAKINRYVESTRWPSKTVPKEQLVSRPSSPIEVVGIAASTGGPTALQKVLVSVPPGIMAGFVVVQHMPRGFTGPFANRLNELCRLEVKEACQNDEVRPGRVLIAPAGYQVEFNRTGTIVTINITEDQGKKSLYKPSADIMFRSLAKAYGNRSLAVILTGMGNDGTEGLKEIKAARSLVLAQDKSSCIVFGMPKSAIEAGVVDRVVPLSDMASTIVNLVQRESWR
ncbi:MAG: chemotaxis response regulator protein-glutamate methylesterase [Syntrophomonadaceae bacterium]|nr:chemotaxis response regulator protein-glutamate methylesterase [Syntrophomonadaceae bacterium]